MTVSIFLWLMRNLYKKVKSLLNQNIFVKIKKRNCKWTSLENFWETGQALAARVSELTNRILPTHSVQKNDIIFKTGYSSSGDFKFNNLLYIWYWKEFLTVTKSEMFLVKKTLFIYGKGHSLRTHSLVMS